MSKTETVPETNKTMKEVCPDCGTKTALACFYSWDHLYCERTKELGFVCANILDSLSHPEVYEETPNEEVKATMKALYDHYTALKDKGLPMRVIWYLMKSEIVNGVKHIAPVEGDEDFSVDDDELDEWKPKKTCFTCYLHHKHTCDTCKTPQSDKELFLYERMARLSAQKAN